MKAENKSKRRKIKQEKFSTPIICAAHQGKLFPFQAKYAYSSILSPET